jgi:copper(I)-binding protein
MSLVNVGRPHGRALAIVAAAAALALTACSSGSSSTATSPTTPTASTGAITVTLAYVNEPTVPERTGAFATIANTGAVAVSLTTASVPGSAAASASVHETVMVGGAMEMKEVTGGVPVPPGGQLVLKPGGYHVMLMMPTVALGQTVPMTLGFSDGSTVTVDALVKAPSSMSASPSMSSSS